MAFIMEDKTHNKILLILDLDETLVFATENELERQADFQAFDYFVYKRPFLDNFLEVIKKEFLIAVWSSASDDYVEAVVRNIFPSEYPLEFVWGRSRCVYRRNSNIDEFGYYWNSTNHYHYIKPLKKLKRKGFRLERMLIVDDTPHKSQLNYGNAIYPKEYTGSLKDDELVFLLDYLMLLKEESNVRSIEKRGWKSRMKA